MKITIYTIKGLAYKLGVSYDYIRQVLVKYQKGDISEFKGFKFFGEPNKAWFAYPKEIELEVIEAPKEEID